MMAWLLALALQDGGSPFRFRDATEEAGILPAAAGVTGHAAGWGDADGDGRPDLFVGTFSSPGGGKKTSLFFRNRGDGKFELDGQECLRVHARTNSGLFADLDNDGDLDLFVSSLPFAGKGAPAKPNSLFRNEGGGKFVDVSEENVACPPTGLAGRSVSAFDYDGDGLLDLLIGDCYYKLYQGSRSSRLFRNLGGLRFKDVSSEVGIPPGIPALGVATGDVNGDGRPDFFLAAREANVLFLNDGQGGFREAPGSRSVFAWKYEAKSGDDTSCGVVFGDVNRDGLADIVVGHHFNRPWDAPVPIRLYLNRAVRQGVPTFEDVTEAAGLVPLPMKAPHVEIEDFDNDGWPDLYTSFVKFADGRPHPMIFRNLGVRDGVPRFSESVLGVNDFPAAEDTGKGFYEKMTRNRKILYSAPGPSADYDGDGRLDLFLASWWPEAPSLLLRNETPSGNWIRIAVEGAPGVNRMGVGSRVRVYPPGKLGDASALLLDREIHTGAGYCSNRPAEAHAGLGRLESCDVEVLLPHGRGRIERKGLPANRRIVLGTP